MINKWEISPSPTDKNKLRHKLTLKCDMKDIFFIVKKLGSVCSRPEKTTGGYNFIIYLSKLEMDTMTKLKDVIKSLSAIKEEVDASASVQEAGISNEPVFDLSQIKEKEDSARAGKAAGQAPDIVPQLGGMNFAPPKLVPPVTGMPSQPPVIPPAAAVPSQVERPQPAQAQPVPRARPPENPAVPETPAEPEKKEAVGKAPEPAVRKEDPKPDTPSSRLGLSVPSFGPPKAARPSGAPPSQTGRMKREEPKKEEKAPAPESKPQESARSKLKWPVELPLNPTLSFQTLIAGPHNRFAHAAAMAVVENPGVMYNPLLIFGPQGIGKSHFMHSMAYGLSSSIGQKNMFVTDAMKLSIGVDLAIKQGWISSIEKILQQAKVVIIDDINLFMLTETSKPYISKLLNECVTSNKQVIVSSLFPPKSLGPLEEALNFQFTQGWMVDIKLPNTQTCRMILNQMLMNMDIKLSEDDIKSIFISKMMDFRTLGKVLSASKKLEKYMATIDSSVIHQDLLSMLTGMGGEDESYPTEYDISDADSFSVPSEKQWFRWGLFYPRGMEKESKFVLMKLRDFAKEININLVWNQVFMEEYNPDEVLGLPFKLGNLASQKDINGLIVLGPQPTSAIGAKEQEFRHLTEKILESFSIKTAWIEASRLKARSNYLKAIMELL